MGLLRVVIALLILGAGLVHAEPPVVGQVSLRLGQAWLIGAQGGRRPLEVEDPVRVGDLVETAASGHVHIRFVDGAVLSVRPNSRLHLADYGDPASGGAIRFKLERGVVRSITGRYGESDRHRFRLNTPIAAIGIAGTDFVVAGDERITRVTVTSGAVIAAPLDIDCRPEDLGPCNTPRALKLAADMGEVMLEIRPHAPAPQLVPKQDLALTEYARRVVSDKAAEASEALTSTAAEKGLGQAASKPAALVWARWDHAPAWPGDHLTQPRALAAEGRERVAENVRYALYRLPQPDPLPTAARLDLGLTAAQAHLLRPGEVLPARVLDGQLALDFALRRFDTRLTLESAPTGQVPFAAAGRIEPDGSFKLIEWQRRLSGAYGVDAGGPAAAYLFEHATPAGMFMGITQWRQVIDGRSSSP